MIYFVCYIAVGLLMGSIDKHGKKFNKLLLFLAIALLTLLAAFRYETMGSDVRGYPLHSFEAAERVTSLHEFVSYMDASMEGGYRLLAFVCTKLFHSLSGVLFGTALLTNGGVILGLYRLRKRISLPFAAMAYCFLSYQETYNMMRQWIAMGIVLYGMIYLLERKPVKYCVTVAVAALFHASAPLALLLYIVAEVVRRKHSVKWQIATVAVTVFGVMNLSAIVEFLISSGWLNSRYMYYVTGNALSFSFPMFIVRVPPIALCAVLYKDMDRKDGFHKVWFLFMIIDMIVSQLHSVMDFAQRIGAYFGLAQMLELSLATRVGSKQQKIIVDMLVLAFLLMYWYAYYIYFNFGSTYPYKAIF